MKKVIAVLLAMLLIFSAFSTVFCVSAEDVEATSAQADASADGTKIDTSGLPTWLQRVIERLVFVFTKLMAKFAIKSALFGSF